MVLWMIFFLFFAFLRLLILHNLISYVPPKNKRAGIANEYTLKNYLYDKF